jgi:hypothetical protein
MTTATNYSADETALTIVDPYNDFMSEIIFAIKNERMVVI